MRHIWAVQDGLQDEDHAAAVVWNMYSFMDTLRMIESGELPAELNDMVYSVEDVRKYMEKEDAKKESMQ
jgi:hypothetical protein